MNDLLSFTLLKLFSIGFLCVVVAARLLQPAHAAQYSCDMVPLLVRTCVSGFIICCGCQEGIHCCADIVVC